MLHLNITPQNSNEQPQVTVPVPEFFKLMGEDGIRAMAKRHYDCIRTSAINHKFPQDDEGFELATRNSAEFFIQICGGPKHYQERRGNPMLKARHNPFTITRAERVVWLTCYQKALAPLQGKLPDEVLQSFWNYIDLFSMWMVQPE